MPPRPEIFSRIDALEERVRHLERFDKLSLGANIAPGSAGGQVPVWDATAASWLPAAAAPLATQATTATTATTASNALALGGSAAATFLQHVLGGAHRSWWTHYGPSVVSGAFTLTIPHLLGATPALIVHTRRIGGPPFDGISSWDASNIVLLFTGAGSAEGWLFAIV
jgi:hypothetical protein